MNRIIILALLIGLLYALYKYQNGLEISNNQPKKIKDKTKSKKPKKKSKEIDFDPESEHDESIYKQDPMVGLDSLGSASLSFLDDQTQDSLFF